MQYNEAEFRQTFSTMRYPSFCGHRPIKPDPGRLILSVYSGIFATTPVYRVCAKCDLAHTVFKDRP